MRLDFHPTIPPSLLPIIRPAVEEAACFMPRWCERLTVFYENDGEADTIASCHPLPEYRSMSIHIRPRFFEEPDGGLNALYHEIGHALLRHLTGRFKRIVEKLSPNETVTDMVMDELNEAEEAVCEDFALFAERLIRKAKGLPG